MKLTSSTLFILFNITAIFAQKQNNIWYFGDAAGLDFNSGAPVPILNTNWGAVEGCASVADRNTGSLLFYSEGARAYYGNNLVMPNGYPMGGGPSASQAAVIVPKPGNCNLYYLFTSANEAHDWLAPYPVAGFSFSIIDMRLNGGLGAVTIRDSVLLKPTTEKCATTLASNGVDVWVVIHQWNSDAFYAYKVTANGISAPVISHTGVVHNDANHDTGFGETIGYMRISNDGTKLALGCEYSLNLMQLFDFNNSTGTVSNPVTDLNFPTGVSGVYGVCFSPNGSKLYITYNGNWNIGIIYQYNMLAGSDSAIIASRTSIGIDSSVTGAIQQGPDGKLYVARSNKDSMGVINNPEGLGAACNYSANGLYLGGTMHTNFMGLPDKVLIGASTDSITVSAETICNGESVTLSAPAGGQYTWSPNTALSSTIADTVIAHPVSSITYTVTGNTAGGCPFTDSAHITVTSLNTLTIIASPDSVCAGSSTNLSVTGSNANMQWQSADSTGAFAPINGATNTSYQTPALNQATAYRLVAQTGACVDTTGPVLVIVLPSPAVPVLTISDSLICASDSTLIEAPQGYYSYLWSTGKTIPAIYVHNPGNYWLTVTNSAGCAAVSAHKQVAVYPSPSISVTISGDTLTAFGAAGYQWFLNGVIIPAATGAVYVARQPGNYTVQVTDANGCTARSNNNYIGTTSLIETEQMPAFNIYPDPFGNVIFITALTDVAKLRNVSLYNVLGEAVINEHTEEILSPRFSLNTTLLPSGLYVIALQTEGKIWLKKLIKQ